MEPSAVPDVRITIHPPDGPPFDVTLSYPLDPEHEALLQSLYESDGLKGVVECRMHDGDYRLRDLRSPDGRVHGVWLYLQHWRDTDQFRLCHWPNGPVAGSHLVPSRMTPEHRAGQEYIARRGEDFGYQVDLEKSFAKGTRSDVIVRAEHVLAAEVQVTGIKLPVVKKRDRAATRAGACTTWFSALTNPPWAYKVPTVLANKRDTMEPGGWSVITGPRILEWEHCGPSSRFEQCPEGRGNFCGKSHPLWTPMPGMFVDRIVEQVPAGELVRIDTATKQGVLLVQRADRDRWQDYVATRPPVPQQRRGGRRGGVSHGDYEAAKLRRRLVPRQREAESTFSRGYQLDDDGHHWPITGVQCLGCSMPLIPCEPDEKYHPGCEPQPRPQRVEVDLKEQERQARQRELIERGQQLSDRLARGTGEHDDPI